MRIAASIASGCCRTRGLASACDGGCSLVVVEMRASGQRMLGVLIGTALQDGKARFQVNITSRYHSGLRCGGATHLLGVSDGGIGPVALGVLNYSVFGRRVLRAGL